LGTKAFKYSGENTITMELTIQIFQDFIVAILLGALIGIEREFSQKKQEFAGIRTFVLITLLGALLAFLADSYGTWLLVLGFVGFSALVAVAYYVTSKKEKTAGATTEVSALVAFVLGVMCVSGMTDMALVLAIIIAVFLSLKPTLHEFARRISREDIYNTLKFAIIAFVILPFLPNQIVFSDFFNSMGLGALDVFNPYETWLVVVLVSGISFGGYVLVKTIGAKRGLFFTGLLGGLASSTAVTTSLSSQSKTSKLVNPFAVGIIIASGIMFIRIIFLVLLLNSELLPMLVIPMLAMALAAIIIAGYLWKSEDKIKLKSKTVFKSPFTLGPALQFGAFFLFILFISNAASIYFGERGVYAAAAISGLADVDALTISMAKLSSDGMSATIAVTAITIAACVNMLVKAGITYYFASKAVSKRVMVAFLLVLIVGGAGLFFV